MTTRGVRWRGAVVHLGVAALFLGSALTGCEREQPLLGKAEETDQQAVTSPDGKGTTPADPRFRQSFAEATRRDPPADWQRPPDATITGKSVGKLYTEVIN